MVKLKDSLYYEDVEIAMEIPPLEKRPNQVQLFLYSAVLQVTHRIHYDQPYAQVEEHPDILVHGPLHGDFLAQLMTNWIGPEGFLKKLSYSNRRRGIPGDILTCKGHVTDKYERDGQRFVECDIWEENQRGEVLVPGSAVVILPSRQAQG